MCRGQNVDGSPCKSKNYPYNGFCHQHHEQDLSGAATLAFTDQGTENLNIAVSALNNTAAVTANAANTIAAMQELIEKTKESKAELERSAVQREQLVDKLSQRCDVLRDTIQKQTTDMTAAAEANKIITAALAAVKAELDAQKAEVEKLDAEVFRLEFEAWLPSVEASIDLDDDYSVWSDHDPVKEVAWDKINEKLIRGLKVEFKDPIELPPPSTSNRPVSQAGNAAIARLASSSAVSPSTVAKKKNKNKNGKSKSSGTKLPHPKQTVGDVVSADDSDDSDFSF
ncbi:hypothetical protein CAOG_06127 [Capsaspora owczarzaki ATCC 30864]|uniref:Uncharacterized protein n=1 Tax=Capsaspora owczarzaki (strain ATCC 30864) TaxID=595528 RepID=A0A0D2VW23_CAPO3|nr:hypothetical protein CAOG_06127 [Capsaspora owczarzaki ATCC 30864]KJE95702.1 hypothetical protein CAOG_006127 [Capsaspora owczarzaki ATCC 30864]|eukprot:XP_004345717.1 hypothetical protein CAOG_06127 [Capsaspora owczarzaki ATCC 30864]